MVAVRDKQGGQKSCAGYSATGKHDGTTDEKRKTARATTGNGKK